jgi:uncharacterized membrane protein
MAGWLNCAHARGRSDPEEGRGRAGAMSKGRVEAFSDGVVAIIIPIMVLEMKPPSGADLLALRGVMPVFLSYVLSFVFVGIYWNNHHVD